MLVSFLDRPRFARGAALAVALAVVGALAVARGDGPPAADPGSRPARYQQFRPCTQRVAAAAVLVRLRSATFDLARFIDADRPGGFAARVLPLTERPAGLTGELDSWRVLEVDLDRTAATALASRLRQLPPIADARVWRAPSPGPAWR
jgi:hypothetical protein